MLPLAVVTGKLREDISLSEIEMRYGCGMDEIVPHADGNKDRGQLWHREGSCSSPRALRMGGRGMHTPQLVHTRLREYTCSLTKSNLHSLFNL